MPHILNQIGRDDHSEMKIWFGRHDQSENTLYIKANINIFVV